MNRLFPHVIRLSGPMRANLLLKHSNAILFQTDRRSLFSRDILGVENYVRQRMAVKEKTGDLKDRFRERMEEYMESATKNTIFTDDLKTIIHVAESDNDTETAVKMIRRYHSQNQELRFSDFVFGSLVMRMLYFLDKPDIAYELFTDQNLDGFFDQMTSYVILMDMLFENQQYERVFNVMATVQDKALAGHKYPLDCVTVTLATCCKLNTESSWETAQKLLLSCKESDTNISMRAIIYGALCAVKQNDAAAAMEILSLTHGPAPGRKTPIAYDNTKVLVFIKLNRLEEALSILKSFLEDDNPDHVLTGNEIFQEILDELGAAVEKENNKELSRMFEVVAKTLTDNGRIADVSFDEYIYRPIFRKRALQDSYKRRPRSGVPGYKQKSGQRAYRPGLLDREESTNY